MNHGTLETAMRLAATDSRHMNPSRPISKPAENPETMQTTVSHLPANVFSDSRLPIKKLLPLETSREIKAQASALAVASASATRHAMFPTGTKAVQSQL